MNLWKCWACCMDWKPLPKHYFCTLFPCSSISESNSFSVLEVLPAATRLCGHHLLPAESLCQALEISDLWVSQLDLTVRWTRPGYLSNVFQCRHPHLSFCSPELLLKQTCGLVLLYLQPQMKLQQCTGQSQNIPNLNKMRGKIKLPQLFFFFADNWSGLSNGMLNVFSKIVLKVYSKPWIGPHYLESRIAQRRLSLFEYSFRAQMFFVSLRLCLEAPKPLSPQQTKATYT